MLALFSGIGRKTSRRRHWEWDGPGPETPMPISTAYTPPPFDYCDEASTGKVIPFIEQSSLSSSIRPPLGPGPETPMPFSTALLTYHYCDEASTFTSHEDTSGKLTPLIEQFSLPSSIRPPLGARERTIFSWLKNMGKLNSLIKRLQELAFSAPPEQRSQLLNKVATLRATFKRQQKRFIQFLKLSEEYADKYLHGISTKIQQQSTALDNLKERSEAANKLHGDAVDLQMYYESGTVAAMKGLRAPTGKSVPCCLQRQNTEIFDFQDFQGHFLRTMRYSARWNP